MNIANAVKEAAKQGTSIRRTAWRKRIGSVLPTNTAGGCLVIPGEGARGGAARYRWQPTMDDLLASDWEVCEAPGGMLRGAGGIENGEEDGVKQDDGTAEVLEPDAGK